MSSDDRTQRSGEVAVVLGLSPAAIRSHARHGRIPYRLTPGRQYRFNLEEVRSILAPVCVDVVADLPDVVAITAPLVDHLSGSRTDSPSAQALRAARIRGHRDRRSSR